MCELLAAVDTPAVCACGTGSSTALDGAVFAAVMVAERAAGAAAIARVVVARFDSLVAMGPAAGIGFRATEVPA
jgi:hypothetical protein